MSNKDFEQYQDNVMDYMEYIGLPPYVETFEPREVARSFHVAMVDAYKAGIRVRMCAIFIFGLTLEKINRDSLKH